MGNIQPNIDNTNLPPLSNEAKFKYIHSKYKVYMRRICLNTCKNNIQDTNDMLQDYFLIIWTEIDLIDVNSEYLKTYLTRAMYNLIMNNRKYNSAQKRNPGDMILSLDYFDSDYEHEDGLLNVIDINDDYESLDLIMDIESILNDIIKNDSRNEIKCNIFRDRVYDRMTFPEICEKYEMNISTTQKYFNEIKNILTISHFYYNSCNK